MVSGCARAESGQNAFAERSVARTNFAPLRFPLRAKRFSGGFVALGAALLSLVDCAECTRCVLVRFIPRRHSAWLASTRLGNRHMGREALRLPMEIS